MKNVYLKQIAANQYTPVGPDEFGWLGDTGPDGERRLLVTDVPDETPPEHVAKSVGRILVCLRVVLPWSQIAAGGPILPRLLSLAQAATLLGRSNTLRTWIGRGLPALRVAETWAIDEDDARWWASTRSKPTGRPKKKA